MQDRCLQCPGEGESCRGSGPLGAAREAFGSGELIRPTRLFCLGKTLALVDAGLLLMQVGHLVLRSGILVWRDHGRCGEAPHAATTGCLRGLPRGRLRGTTTPEMKS